MYYGLKKMARLLLLILVINIPASFAEETATTDIATLITQGETAIDEKRYDDAITLAQQVIAQDIENARAYLIWGDALGWQGYFKDSLKKIEHSAKLDPYYAQTYVIWGEVLSADGDNDEAIKKFKQAVELEPQNARAYLGWGISLSYKGESSKACKKYQKALN